MSSGCCTNIAASQARCTGSAILNSMALSSHDHLATAHGSSEHRALADPSGIDKKYDAASRMRAAASEPMTELAFGILSAAGLIGLGLALRYLRGPAAPPSDPAVPALHGAVGTAGLAVLLAALNRPRLPNALGTAGFGDISAALLVLALLLGLAIALAAWRGRRPAGALVGAHAGLAIAGLVMLLALVALG
jgi:hypothetical protein